MKIGIYANIPHNAKLTPNIENSCHILTIRKKKRKSQLAKGGNRPKDDWALKKRLPVPDSLITVVLERALEDGGGWSGGY